MYRIVLKWHPVRSEIGRQAAADIRDGFSVRDWHKNVSCIWSSNDNSITLQVENDFDPQGLATSDEFSDEICATVKDAGDGDISIVSIETI
jgi:hypothetical protein